MDRDKLMAFVVLSETLNFSEAAEQLYMTQSALSKKIKALEKELGEELFKRDTRNIRLSKFGSSFLPYARQILTAYESSSLFIEKYRQSHRKQVTLGTINNLECFHIDKIFVGFEGNYPEIHLNLKEDALMTLYEMFHRGELHLYCTCDMLVDQTTEFIPIGNGYLVVLCPADDPLAQKEFVSVEDLSGKSLLLPAEIDPYYQMILNEFESAGISPNVVYKGTGMSSISLVHAGVGVAILPVQIASKYAGADTAMSRFSHGFDYQYGLGYRSRNGLTESEKLFVDYVEQFGKSLLSNL